MKISNLSFWFCILFVGQAAGADHIEEYAHQLCERDKQRMVDTKVITPAQRQALESEENQLRNQIATALISGNSTDIEEYQCAFFEFVNRYVTLAEQAQAHVQALKEQTTN